MAEISLHARKRTELGKQDVKRLRKAGSIPAVVYGKSTEPFSLQISERDFFKLAHGEHGSSLASILISLFIDDDKSKKKMTLIKEIQHDPITGEVMHIDFHEISLTEKIHAHIPIVASGTSRGEKEGGIVDQTLRELEITCLPTDLPKEIKVDISDLGLHGSIHVRDLDLGDKVEVLTDKDLSIVSIVVPRVVEEVVEEVLEKEEAEEPEVIGKKAEEEKKEEEGKSE